MYHFFFPVGYIDGQCEKRFSTNDINEEKKKLKKKSSVTFWHSMAICYEWKISCQNTNSLYWWPSPDVTRQNLFLDFVTQKTRRVFTTTVITSPRRFFRVTRVSIVTRLWMMMDTLSFRCYCFPQWDLSFDVVREKIRRHKKSIIDDHRPTLWLEHFLHRKLYPGDWNIVFWMSPLDIDNDKVVSRNSMDNFDLSESILSFRVWKAQKRPRLENLVFELFESAFNTCSFSTEAAGPWKSYVISSCKKTPRVAKHEQSFASLS